MAQALEARTDRENEPQLGRPVREFALKLGVIVHAGSRIFPLEIPGYLEKIISSHKIHFPERRSLIRDPAKTTSAVPATLGNEDRACIGEVVRPRMHHSIPEVYRFNRLEVSIAHTFLAIDPGKGFFETPD